jgi:hypothetical protein
MLLPFLFLRPLSTLINIERRRLVSTASVNLSSKRVMLAFFLLANGKRGGTKQ